MLEKLEVVVVLVLVVLVLFGSKKIPEAARNIGASVKELRKGFNEGEKTETAAKPAEKPTTKDKE